MIYGRSPDPAPPHGQDTRKVRLLRHPPWRLQRDRQLHHPALRQESHSAATEGEMSSLIKVVGKGRASKRLHLVRSLILH